MRRRLTRLAAIAVGTIALGLVTAGALLRNPGTRNGGTDAGARLYRDLGCASCHGPATDGGSDRLSLAGVGSRLDSAGIRQAIIGAGAPHRRRYERIPAAEVDAIVAYLRSGPET